MKTRILLVLLAVGVASLGLAQTPESKQSSSPTSNQYRIRIAEPIEGSTITGRTVNIVLVEDDVEFLRRRFLHQPVEDGVPARGQLELVVHLAEAVEIDPHGVEATVLDDLEVPRLEAAPGRVLPQRVVTDDVHAALHLRDLVGGGQGLSLCVTHRHGNET